MSIFDPMLLPFILNQYTKFEVSTLNGCGDIFDKNLERKKKEQIQGRTNRRMPICNPTIQLVSLVIANLYTKFEDSVLNGCGDIFDENSGETEKKNKYREEQIEGGPFSIPRYNLSL